MYEKRIFSDGKYVLSHIENFYIIFIFFWIQKNFSGCAYENLKKIWTLLVYTKQTRRGAIWNEGVEIELHKQIIFQLVQTSLLTEEADDQQ